MENPINGEVVAALTAFVRGGRGPSHSSLTSAFLAAGIVGLTPYTGGSLDQLNLNPPVDVVRVFVLVDPVWD